MKIKAGIHGHHVYKRTWTPIMDEDLICKKGNQEEAKEYDRNVAGVCKQSPKQGNLDLAGNVPIELSRILAGFLAASESNFPIVQVCGKQKCEVGSCHSWILASSNRQETIADMFSTEIRMIKECYPYF